MILKFILRYYGNPHTQVMTVKKLEKDAGSKVARNGEYTYRGNTYQVLNFENHSDEDNKWTPQLGDREVEEVNQYIWEQIGRPKFVVLDEYCK